MFDVCLTFTMQFYKGLHSIVRQMSDISLPHFVYTDRVNCLSNPHPCSLSVFQYSAKDTSPISNYITHPFWNWIVEVGNNSFFFMHTQLWFPTPDRDFRWFESDFRYFCEVITAKKNIVEEKELTMGACVEWSSPLWVYNPQKSQAIALDLWNTNSLGWTLFRTGAHDGLPISYIPSSARQRSSRAWYFSIYGTIRSLKNFMTIYDSSLQLMFTFFMTYHGTSYGCFGCARSWPGDLT